MPTKLDKSAGRAWIVSVSMGYGHQRTAYPLKDLAQEGKIINANDYPGIPESDRKIWEASRGFYEFVSNFERLPLIGKPSSGSPMDAKELLHSKGIEFMITGEAVFYRYIHNLPKRLIELVYVVKGSGEYAVSTLREAGLRALLNPTRNEISVALESFSERDLFVIREFSKLTGNVNGFASLERALVDLYFETTRNRIPAPKEEVARIFLNVLEKEPISYSRLITFAARRGIGNEIREILNFVNPTVSPTKKLGNKQAVEFLDLLHKLGWR